LKISGGGSDGGDGIGEKNFETWVKKQVGLKDNALSREQYDAISEQGVEKARMRFHAESPPVVTAAVIKTVHYDIFDPLHHKADQFRQPGQEEIFILGKKGVVPDDIPNAINELQKNAELAFSKPALFDQATAIACHFLRLKEIQPFMDGNGRTAGVIMEAQMKSCLFKDTPELQNTFNLVVDADQFYTALGEGIIDHNPKKMIEVVISCSGIADRILFEEGKTVSELMNGERWKEISNLFLPPETHVHGPHIGLKHPEVEVTTKLAQEVRKEIVSDHIPSLNAKILETQSKLAEQPENSHQRPTLEKELRTLDVELSRAIATASWCETKSGQKLEFIVTPSHGAGVSTPVPRDAKHQLEVAALMTSVMKLPAGDRESILHAKQSAPEADSKKLPQHEPGAQQKPAATAVEGPLPLRIATETTVKSKVLEQLTNKELKELILNPLVKSINFVPISELKLAYEGEKAFAAKNLPAETKEQLGLEKVKCILREETARAATTEKRLDSSKTVPPQSKKPVHKSVEQTKDTSKRHRED
jgi:fido (protein-threonine AMPylation protein)